jgi:hypothetical protein
MKCMMYSGNTSYIEENMLNFSTYYSVLQGYMLFGAGGKKR